MSVVTFPRVIPLDANNLPERHGEALQACAREFADYLNEMPSDQFIHMCPTDIECGVERVIARYLHVVRNKDRR